MKANRRTEGIWKVTGGWKGAEGTAGFGGLLYVPVAAVELLFGCMVGLPRPALHHRGELPLFHQPGLDLEVQLLDLLLLVDPPWVVLLLCPPGQVPPLILLGPHLKFRLGQTVLLLVSPGKS